MSSISHKFQQTPCCHHSGRKYGGIHKQTNIEGQVSQQNLQYYGADNCVELQAHGIQQHDIKLSNISGRYKQF